MAQHGKGSRRAANKWVLAAKQLPAAVVETLKGMPYLKVSYVLENDYFVTGGSRLKESLLSEDYQQRALKLLINENTMKKVTTSSKNFSSDLCRSLKAVQNLELHIVRKYGEALTKGNARNNLVRSLCTESGLKKVLSCLAAGIPLQGKSESEVGILEVRNYINELEKCKAGGDQPAPTDNKGQSPVKDGSRTAPYADIRDVAEFATLVAAGGETQVQRLSEEDREHIEETQAYISTVTFYQEPDKVRVAAISRKDARITVIIDAGTSGKVGYAVLIDLAYDITKVSTQSQHVVVLTLLRSRLDLLSDVKMKLESKYLEGALVGGHVLYLPQTALALARSCLSDQMRATLPPPAFKGKLVQPPPRPSPSLR